MSHLRMAIRYYMKRASLIILLFLLIAGAFYEVLHFTSPATGVKAQKGVLDLSRPGALTRPVALDGEWRFYWHQLLYPGDRPSDTAFVSFPSLWKNDRLNGQSLSSEGYATYGLTVILPPGNPRLALRLPDTYCSYALYANGELLEKNGRPGTSRATAIPFWTTKVVNLDARADTVRLLLQVANFWHAKGGTYKEIMLGPGDQIFLQRERDAAYDLVLTGCLLMGGLFFLGLYIFGRHNKAILYFSLFCILYSYRMPGTQLYVLHALFPSLPWWFTVRLEYLTLTLAVAFFALYTKHLFREDVHPLGMGILYWFCLAYSAVIVLTPSRIFTAFMGIFLIVMFLYIGYAFYIYIIAAIRKRPGSVYALLSSSVMLLIFLLVNLHYFHMIPPMRALLFTGYIAFFFLQSLALSHRFAFSFKLATQQAQQGLKAKSEFLSTMSHEIRTPLNAVIGMAHLLIRNRPRDDQKENLDVLLFSANNLLSIVNNILDYNKIEAGKISFEQIPMNLATIGRNIAAGLRTAATEKGIDLRFSADEKLDQKLVGDPTRTTQVITNLVHNAIKFTKEGWIGLSMKVEEANDREMRVTIRVRDTGIGIEAEKQQLIFDRFTQADSSTSRSYGGTGLGLAISKRILELQGVTLRLKSEPGQGAEFYFTQCFPVSAEKGNEGGNGEFSDNSDGKSLQGISILLVEDNPFNVMVAQTILQNAGAVVDVATNGREALDHFDHSRHRLVLMDLHMPVMDGYEATARLRSQGETLPVIALTASTPKEVESEAFASGLTDVIVKPFNPEDLYRMILQYV